MQFYMMSSNPNRKDLRATSTSRHCGTYYYIWMPLNQSQPTRVARLTFATFCVRQSTRVKLSYDLSASKGNFRVKINTSEVFLLRTMPQFRDIKNLLMLHIFYLLFGFWSIDIGIDK